MSVIDEVHCKVFVGFGGSGCKTLTELARMYAADKELAARCESEAYFLLVDTDQGDLEKYAQNIQAEFAAVSETPFVKAIPLAQGVTRMDSAILAAMKAAKTSDKGLQRMRQVWWFDEKDKPFIARNLQTPPSQGAAQCPAISYFLSWKAMQGTGSLIGSAITELCDEIDRRAALHHSARRSKRLSLNLVAGLAGGTGRGCWAPLSMRIQQELRAQGYEAFPTGVFFDQSCYEDIQRHTQGQRVKMIVNSLTGISELAGWIDNDLNHSERRRGKRYFAQLPSFHAPQTSSQDVVNSRKLLSKGDEDGAGGGEGDSQGATPVNKAFMVFARGRAGRLAPGEHYKLAASALYGQTSEEVIASEESNERTYFGSLGASSFRVNVHQIREYLVDRMEHDCIRDLAAVGSVAGKAGGSRASSEALKIADALLLPLQIDGSEKAKFTVPDNAKKNEPKLLSRLQAALVKSTKSKVTEFLEGLEEMDPTEYEANLKGLTKNRAQGAGLEQAFAQCLGDAIAHAFQPGLVHGGEEAGPADVVEQYLRHALTTALEDPGADFAAGDAGATHLDAHVSSFAISQQVLDQLASKLPDLVSRAEAAAKGGESMATIVQKLKKARRSRKFLVAGTRFDEGERTEIRAALISYILATGRAALPAVLEKTLKPLRSMLTAWKSNLDYAVQAAEQRASELSRTKLTTEHTDRVFTTPGELKKWAREAPDSRSYYEPDRYLEPYATEDDFEVWGRDLRQAADARLAEALCDIQARVLTKAMTGRRKKAEQREVERELYRELDQFRSNIVITREWLADRFGLMTVAERLVHAFADKIEECAASPKQVGALQDHFLRQFGFELKARRNRIEVPSAKEIVIKMATDLGENCCAQYKIDGAVEGLETKTAHVFLPTDEKLAGNSHAAKQLKKDCEKHAREVRSSVQYHVDPARIADSEEVDGRSNPFLMLAMVTQGFQPGDTGSGPMETSAAHDMFEHISSLRYHASDSDSHVKTFLEWAERPDGKSIFADVQYSFGLGYILPAFVTHEGLREARWRPWAKDVDQQVERQANAGVDAMLYAMLGIAGKGASPVYKQQVERDDGSKVKWTLPLIKFGGAETKNGFSFTRKAFCDDYGFWDTCATAFEGDETVGSIAKLVGLFADDEDYQKAIAAEAAHFFGTLCTEEGIIERTVQAEFRALREWVRGTLRKRLEGLPAFAVDFSDHLDRLEARALELAKMKRAELAELYRGA